MNIKYLVKEIVESITIGDFTYNFGHAEKDWQNLMGDEGILPAIYLDEPVETQYILHQSGLIQEMYKLSFVFLHDSELDWTPEQHDVLKQIARRGAKIMLSKMMGSPLLKSVTNAGSVEYQNEYDRNCTGLFLNVFILPYDDEPVC